MIDPRQTLAGKLGRELLSEEGKNAIYNGQYTGVGGVDVVGLRNDI